MQVALTGLAQSGISTLFAAVAEGHVHAAAGAAHQVDQAVVKVPDERIDKLSAIYKPKKTTHATIEFLALPGLSFADEPGRHEARRIIAQARQADMLVMVLRDFHSESVAAYRNRVDPARDFEELKNELLLADLELVANRIEKLEKAITKPTTHVEQQKRELALLQRCSEALEDVQGLSGVIESDEQEKALRSFGFLSLKPICVVVNVDEDAVGRPAAISAETTGAEVLVVSAALEAELAALAPSERREFLEEMALEEIARDRLVHTCFRSLSLISFLTIGADEVRAWPVSANCSAVEAAGAVHSDIQRGFIRAETVHWSDFEAAGDMKAAKAAGKVRLEGKHYQVQDGDIINFRFNV